MCCVLRPTLICCTQCELHVHIVGVCAGEDMLSQD